MPQKTLPSGLYHSPVGIGPVALEKNASVVEPANLIPAFAQRLRPCSYHLGTEWKRFPLNPTNPTNAPKPLGKYRIF